MRLPSPAAKLTKSDASARTRPRLALALTGGCLAISAHGAWTIDHTPAIEDELAVAYRQIQRLVPDGVVLVLLSELDRIDTSGAFLLERALGDWRRAGYRIDLIGGSAVAETLLAAVRPAAFALVRAPESAPRPAGILAELRAAVAELGADTVALLGFLGQVTAVIGTTMARPSRFRLTAFVHHLEHAGLRALPIVALICLLIGAVVMQQGAVQLRPFGAEIFAINMLAILSLREVGVLLTAIMIAGRSGSAYTAEIGAMKMREEIDAMRTLGLNPMETLVLPRLLALLVALPLITFLGAMMCLAGGGIAAVFTLDMDWLTYLDRLRDAATLNHLFVGMIKTPFIALAIGLVGCVEGLKVAGSAESLGARVTGSVVRAIFLVIVIDGLFAIALAGLGY